MNNVSCYLKKRKKKEENKPKASRRKETIKIRPERNKIVNKKNNRENQWNKRPVPWKCNQIDNSLANWQRHKLLLSGIKQGFMTNPTDIRRIVRKYYEQLPARLLCPWNSPGRNTGVGSHSLLQGSSHSGFEPGSPALQADLLLSAPPGKPMNKCTQINLAMDQFL